MCPFEVYELPSVVWIWGKGSMNLEGRLLGGGKFVGGRIKRDG
jgi:hypothetical protein